MRVKLRYKERVPGARFHGPDGKPLPLGTEMDVPENSAIKMLRYGWVVVKESTKAKTSLKEETKTEKKTLKDNK